MDLRWGKLPYDLLEYIVDRLGVHTDILNFRSVCMKWNSFVLQNLHCLPRQLPLSRCLPQQCRLPLAMLPFAEGMTTRDFFCLSEQKMYAGFLLPESRNKWICGSSYGWLVTNDISGPELHLLNPFTRTRLCLPPSTTIPQPKCDSSRYGIGTMRYIWKVVLSSKPISNIEDCLIMAIASFCCVLSFCRLGDNKWTNINGSPTLIEDVIFYKGQFYAVNEYGLVVVCDIGSDPKATAIVGEIEQDIVGKRYLVESSGELLQVVRHMTTEEPECDGVHITYKTTRFHVFKLEEKGAKEDKDKEEHRPANYRTIESNIVYLKNTRYKWVEVESLGDQMLFLGYNHSMSLSAHSFPNCKENCIYFIDDYMDGHVGRQMRGNRSVCHDIGMFNLDDGSILPYLPKPIDFLMPPIWVTPEPW